MSSKPVKNAFRKIVFRVLLPDRQITYTDIMGEPRVAMKELAQRLIAFEEASDLGSNPGPNAAFRTLIKLRLLLVRFSGLDGFAALMRRAITLSRIENPSLEGCTLGKDGSIESLEEISVEAGLSLAAQLLDLMTTFIGEALTLRLLADIWPVEAKS